MVAPWMVAGRKPDKVALAFSVPPAAVKYTGLLAVVGRLVEKLTPVLSVPAARLMKASESGLLPAPVALPICSGWAPVRTSPPARFREANNLPRSDAFR